MCEHQDYCEKPYCDGCPNMVELSGEELLADIYDELTPEELERLHKEEEANASGFRFDPEDDEIPF